MSNLLGIWYCHACKKSWLDDVCQSCGKLILLESEWAEAYAEFPLPKRKREKITVVEKPKTPKEKKLVFKERPRVKTARNFPFDEDKYLYDNFESQKAKSINAMIYSGINNKKKVNSSYNRKTKWSLAVRKRDLFRCQRCGSEENLTAHHIKPQAEFPELKYKVDNGITLCRTCHDIEHDCLPKTVNKMAVVSSKYIEPFETILPLTTKRIGAL